MAAIPLSSQCELGLSLGQSGLMAWGLKCENKKHLCFYYRAYSPAVLPYKTHNITWRLGVNVTHPTHFTSEWEVQVEVSCDKVCMPGPYDLQQNNLRKGI